MGAAQGLVLESGCMMLEFLHHGIFRVSVVTAISLIYLHMLHIRCS